MGYPANYGPRTCAVCRGRFDVRSMTHYHGTRQGRRYVCAACRRLLVRLGALVPCRRATGGA